MLLDRLLHAEVIYVGGGNHYHLAGSITGNGLADGFLKAPEDRVYVEVSAGSMISAGISASAPPTSWATSRTCTSSA
jgi:peptidase E